MARILAAITSALRDNMQPNAKACTSTAGPRARTCARPALRLAGPRRIGSL